MDPGARKVSPSLSPKSEQRPRRVAICSHFTFPCCYFSLLLMLRLYDVMGFCISLRLFCLTFSCFCLILSSNREQPPGSFVRADSAERAYLRCKTRRGACNVCSREQLMRGEESVSVLIHADTVSFFFFFFHNLFDIWLGKTAGKNCFKRPLKFVLVTAVVTL